VNATFKLTKRAIDAATPQERRNEVWDAELKGFGVRIEPSGLKTFILPRDDPRWNQDRPTQ